MSEHGDKGSGPRLHPGAIGAAPINQTARGTPPPASKRLLVAVARINQSVRRAEARIAKLEVGVDHMEQSLRDLRADMMAEFSYKGRRFM